MNRTTQRRRRPSREVDDAARRDPTPQRDDSAGASFPETSNSAARRRFVAVAVAGAVWVASLALLAALTANPVTVSLRQIDEADLVVLVRVIDPEAGSARVEKSWKGPLDVQELTIDNLKETAAKADERYLIPLQRTRQGQYFIDSRRMRRDQRLPDGRLPLDRQEAGRPQPPVIYPASSAVIEQVEEAVKDRVARPVVGQVVR